MRSLEPRGLPYSSPRFFLNLTTTPIMESEVSTPIIITDDYVLIGDVSSLVPVLNDLFDLPRHPPSLYVDLEGWDLCRHGRVSLITIYAAPLNKTFLVDVQILGEQAFTCAEPGTERTLQAILEDPEIPKVFFDCRNDSDALFNLYNVNMSGNVFLVAFGLFAC